jgi:N-acyl-D-aspartate/D-glutamate deacylase
MSGQTLFDPREGVRRLTSHQAGLNGIPDRGRIETGAFADFCWCAAARQIVDPARRRHSANPRPAGRPRGIFVNGVAVFDGTNYRRMPKGPGQVFDHFRPSGPGLIRSAAE